MNHNTPVYIGNHLSSSAGFLAMGKHAVKLGANTFAFFTRNPRGGKAKEIDSADAEALCSFLDEHDFGTLVAHAPYTMNLCSNKQDIRDFARNMLREDLQERMEAVPGCCYNFHPGSHVGQGSEQGILYIADALNEVLFEGMHTTVLLETMAGKGSEIGRNFQELQNILEKVTLDRYMGVCLDTCHIWYGGYDLDDFESVLDDFDRTIGLDRLKAIHLNDSMNPKGAGKDRHQKLGEGEIGLERLKNVVMNPRVQGLPMILETPNEDDGYAKEIELVKSWFV